MGDRAADKKIHVRLPPALHRRLRVRCARLDTTIQEFVVELLNRELGGAQGPAVPGGRGLDQRLGPQEEGDG